MNNDVYDLKHGLGTIVEDTGARLKVKFSNYNNTVAYYDKTTMTKENMEYRTLFDVGTGIKLVKLSDNIQIDDLFSETIIDDISRNLSSEARSKFIFKISSKDIINYLSGLVEANMSSMIHIGRNYMFEPNELKLYKNNQEIKLPPASSKLLRVLLTKPNEMVSIDNLKIAITTNKGLASISTIRASVRNINNTIGINIVKSVYGGGYMINIAI